MDASLTPPPATGPLSAVLEASLIRLFEPATVSFHVMDPEGRVLHGNERFRAFLGAGPEGLPQVGFERLRGDLAPARARAWFQAIFDRPGDLSELATWQRLDGQEMAVSMTVAALQTQGGPRLFIWARDRSEEKLTTDRLAERADAQQHLADGIYALSLARTREELFQVLMGRASALLPGFHWLLGEVPAEGGGRDAGPAACTPALRARQGAAVLELSRAVLDTGFAREVRDHRRLGFLPEVRAAADRVPEATVEAFGLEGLLGAPLVFEGRVLGVLCGISFRGERWVAPREAQLDCLHGLSRIAALALERIRAEARLGDAAALARDLATAVRDLSAAKDEPALAAALFAWAARLAPLPAWWFNRFEAASRTTLTCHWTPGLEAYVPPGEIGRPAAVDGSPLLAGLYLHQRALHIPRCEGHPDLSDPGAWPLRTLVGLPLAHEGEVIGALLGGSLGAQGHVPVSAERFKTLESLAEAAGLVLNRLEARRALEAEEARFRRLFEQSPDPILLISQAGIVGANAAAAQLLGLDRRAPGTRPLAAVLPAGADPSDGGWSRFEAALQAAWGGSQERFEWRFRRPDGEEAVCQVSLSRVDHGDQPLLHAILHDLTALKRGETERVALERQLFQAQKMESLGVLAGGIAHDFNNLLMGVLGHAGLALEQMNPQNPARHHLEAIQRAGQRAADLTRQMLAYSGRGQFILRELDLSAQVEELAHLLQVSLPKGVVLNLRLQKGLPRVSADPSQVQQVIMNLVINAAEAIGEASGSISLATGVRQLDAPALASMLVGREAAPGPYTYLDVTDSGCGMEADLLGRVFEPFFTTKFTGRGLGLSAIQGIVRSHRGALEVHSEPGRGSAFRVCFPALPPAAGEATLAAGEAAWTHRGVVLVVDDDETVRAVARQTLERVGLTVLEARDGREAVDRVGQEGADLDLVLLDMTMPHMGGEETFREMRRLRPDLPVLLSSGYREEDALGRFGERGLRGFVQKPYGPRELLAQVRRVLEG